MLENKIIYLDYAATTPVAKEVLDCLNKVTTEYIGNPNSLHKLGIAANELIVESTKIIANFLNIKPSEIIYTSGASESNNLAIKGIIKSYPKRNKLILTTKLEHSSISTPLRTLSKEGYIIKTIKLQEDGTVDLKDLKSLLMEEPVLVTIACVDSELGIRQPIEEIGKIIKEYPKTIFHSDITQAIGKTTFSLENVDLASLSAHKFYCFKGIGVLVKKENILLHSEIEGGKSTTIYRSGTPNLPLIASCAKALKILPIKDLSDFHNLIVENLKKYEKVRINSTNKSVPNIINFSILGVKSETFLHMLEEYNIYISTKTACSNNSDYSLSVLEVTKDEKRALSSLRISISPKTTKEEITSFLNTFDECYKKIV